MEKQFERKTIPNVIRSLNNDEALRLVALSLAANDLSLNVEALGRFSESKNIYFLVTSLSILRELAKLVAKIEEGTFQEKMSKETVDLLKVVQSFLASFEKGSLVGDVLKPIRDVTFHYSFTGIKGYKKALIDNALNKVMAQDYLDIDFEDGVNSALGQRYAYAEKFRSNILSQLLNEQLVSTLSAVSVNIIVLVDSLLSDLKLSNNGSKLT